ncbi:ammonium transporter [Geobacter argillaceus]|uniref:Ammonium transporter n=2 Tax=Geobacter argillaceus TaxID=345631 RepID=A0A562W8E9_9BACT|nr:ammonium transporter [Geobacter argillaceus]TWJ26506.1 ammonium transporter (TC 1.A.11) [Geobacter argillaceus]
MKGAYRKFTGILGVMVLALIIAVPVFPEDKPAPAAAPGRAQAHVITETSTTAIAASPSPTVIKPDPSGANTGGVGDVPGGSANAPTREEITKAAMTEPLAVKLADVIGHNRIAINIAWTLVCGFLVMFMQVGFALVETGLCRAKNASHTMAMNVMIYCIGLLAYWACGFAIQMGGVGSLPTLGGGQVLNGEFTLHLFGKAFGLFGTKGFFLSGSTYDACVFTIFLFQMVFMDTAATIPTGAMAERFKFSAFVVYGFLMAGLIYPLFANWVWGGGWLSALGSNFHFGHGHVDFAGSSVVHMTGGVCALAGSLVLGPRFGKYGKDGFARPIPGHHIPMAITGALILAFGWFGFNTGSTLSGTDLRIGVVATNTMLASAAGGFSAMLYMWLRFGKPDLTMSANGLLAGLVGITAPCAFVNSVSAVAIGLVAGVLCCLSVFFFERVVKVDDPVGAVSVHGVCGAWGVISLGLFADGTYGDGFNNVKGSVRGLFYGDSSQLIAQCIGIVTNIVFVFAISYVAFKLIDLAIGMRVSREVEIDGLDHHEVAVEAYPDFSQRRT